MLTDQHGAVQKDGLGSGDWTRFWRDGRFDNIECLHARFRQHVYAPHTHETYVVGVIVDGVEEFTCRGALHRAGPGMVTIVNPDEVHDGRPLQDGYAYRMFYPSEALLQQVGEELGEYNAPIPRFTDLLSPDPVTAEALLAAHRLMENSCDPLERQAAMLRAMGVVLMRHASQPVRVAQLDGAPHKLRRLCEMIDAHLAEPMDLDRLAQAAGMGRFQVIRAFRHHTGLTPSAYVTNQRVRRARGFLAKGMPPADVAAAVGFYDQSHLNRAFKARIGITPGQYRLARNPVQDGLSGVA